MWSPKDAGDRHAGAVRGYLKAELLVKALEMVGAFVHLFLPSLLHPWQGAPRVTAGVEVSEETDNRCIWAGSGSEQAREEVSNCRVCLCDGEGLVLGTGHL